MENRIIRWIMAKEHYISIAVAMLGIVFTMIVAFYSPKSIKDDHEYVDKAVLKNKISTVIKNGGGLDVVKKAFKSRVIEHSNSPVSDYYDNDCLSLSDVLDDLLVDFYSASMPNQGRDTIYLNRLCSIINEFSLNNPFDELEKEQSVHFQNIQAKLADGYALIKDDMMFVADDLKDKNALTKEYLKKSNYSFWISIGAVVITIMLGVIQIIQNYFKKINDELVVDRILKELNNRDKSNNEQNRSQEKNGINK